MRKIISLTVVVLLTGVGGAGAVAAASTSSHSAACWKSETTLDIANCFAASGKKSDVELNRLYGKIMIVLDTDDRRQLQKAERLWVAYREAACGAERSLWGGGSGGNPAYLACVDDETRHHLDYLQTTYRLRIQKQEQ